MAAALLLTGGYLGWIVSGAYSARTEAIASSILVIGLHLQFGWFAWLFARSLRGGARLRRSWTLLALSGLFGAVAEIVWFVLESLLQIEPYLSVADVFFWLQHATLLAGVLSFPFSWAGWTERALFRLDIGIVMTAGLMVIWYFIVAPLWGRFSGDPLQANSLAFVSAGLLVLAAVTAVLQSDLESVAHETLLLLCAGMTLLVIANTLLAYVLLLDAKLDPVGLNLLWVVSGSFMAWSSTFQVQALTRPTPATRWAASIRSAVRLALPYAATAFAIGLLVIALESDASELSIRGLLVGAVILVALAMARQLVLLRQNRRLYEQARHASMTDALTGLWNRLHLTQALRAEVERCRRYDHPLSVLVIDVNGFKSINDQMGHAEGDRVLAAMARILSAQTRDHDIVGRWGGDEFLSLLPHTELQGARHCADRIRSAIEGAALTQSRLGVSIGAATLSPDGSWEDLIEQADRDMYVQKQATYVDRAG